MITNKKDAKKALSYELLPTAKGFIMWIYFVIQNQIKIIL